MPVAQPDLQAMRYACGGEKIKSEQRVWHRKSKVKDRQDKSARSLCWTGGPSSDDREKWKEIDKPRTTSTDGEN